jgi:DNA-binding SARP family transcriptional activator
MSEIRVRLLGGFALSVDGDPAPRDGWGRRSAAALVKLLALAPGHRLHREQVVDALWSAVSVDRAIARLHKAAFFARQAVPGSVVLRGEVVALFPDDRVVVDVEEFERLAKDAVTTHDDDSLAGALEIYGPLLPDDRYEPWVERRADALHVRHLELLRVARRWNDILELDPADELAHLTLARLHNDSGNRLAALRQLERLERALSDLGLAMSNDASQLRLLLTGGGTKPSSAARRPDRHHESRHRLEHRRRAMLVDGRHRTRPLRDNALTASCGAALSCC